uniref:Uncharacterized protein n=1 Tax=Triticum urartu TaxID=4572 RepID=A0A8R7UCY3_TRIUA
MQNQVTMHITVTNADMFKDAANRIFHPQIEIQCTSLYQQIPYSNIRVHLDEIFPSRYLLAILWTASTTIFVSCSRPSRGYLSEWSILKISSAGEFSTMCERNST